MADEERVKASLTDTASIANTLTKQISVEENPFREGGPISKDADEIIDYYKQGKLSVLSNPPPMSELCPPSPQPTTISNTPTTPTHMSPCNTSNTDITDSVVRDRKNGTYLKEKPGLVQVEHAVVDNGAQCRVEKVVLIPDKEKKCACCVIV